jgi:peroxiredoxin
MITKLCLLTCALTAAQLPDRSTWLLQLQFAQGQELTYGGSFVEETLTPGVHFQRTYRLETRACVLQASPHKAQVALLTVLSLRSNRPTRDPAAGPTSVRLELVEIDERGRVHGRPGVNFAVSLEGPPTVECGAFVEVPAKRLGVNQSWEVVDPGRPPLTWRIAGTETVAGTPCIKLVGQQESDDWNSPRGDRGAWRRRDTVWMAPGQGIAYRVERILERRDPARETPTHRAVLRYELDSRLTYPGELFASRRQEIHQAEKFIEEATPFLRQPAQRREQLDTLLKRITNYLEVQPPTPYRNAIVQIQRRLEGARRGEIAPELAPEEVTPSLPRAVVGRPAPDFLATDLSTGKSVRLQRLLGKPLLLCFYNPRTDTGAQVLRFAQGLCESYPNRVQVLGMVVTEEAEEARKQHAALKLTFPLLEGNGLHLTYDVQATPRLVLIGADGIVRGLYMGWGPQSSREVTSDLQRWLK